MSSTQVDSEKQSKHSTDSVTLENTSPVLSVKEATETVTKDGGVDASDEIQYPKGWSLAFVLMATIFSVFLLALDQTIVATAIPRITDEFGGLDKVSWYGSAYFMTFGGFNSSWGKAFKYFSLKWTFLLSVFVFELGSLICGVAPNPTALIVGRAIAGVGGAGMASGSFIIVAFSANSKRRPLFTGLLGATYGISAVLGPLLGGALTSNATWRWCFYINLPIGGLAMALIVLFFHTPDHAKPVEASWKEKALQMDPVGVVMVMGFIVTFTLAMQYGGQTKAWHSSIVIGLLVGFVLMLAAFVAWEIFQGERAMVVPRLFKQRIVWAGAFFQCFFAGAYFILLYYLPIYFQSIDNTSPIGSGVRNIPLVLAVCIFGMVGGILVSTTGHAVPFMVPSSALVVVGCGLIYTLDIGTNSAHWIGYQVCVGTFLAIPWMMSINIVQSHSQPSDISAATSVVFFFQMLGGSFGLSAAQAALANVIISTLATSAPDINPQIVLETGATQLRDVFSAQEIPGVLIAYMHGIKATFAIAIGMAGIAFIVSGMNSWKRLHGGPEGKQEVVAAGV